MADSLLLPRTADLYESVPEEAETPFDELLTTLLLLIVPEALLFPRPPLPDMLQEALKVAPGSTDNLATVTVPSITAEDFRDKRSET